ncbi:DUF58 domain-containing protein [Antribacter gilvus]|uniref:DUF58 domain-containing protein n=1 Tax=Antribacter gilvus TaxID=2304675 RepID=UPI000F7A88AC|nr:DUF58 domain-containing protein [Antribacter gilvus]
MPDVSRLSQVRARLDLPVARRATGLLEGRHRSIYKGHGQDFDDLHLYSPGEDVGDIDWKSSARAGIPVVRRFVSESNLNLVLIVDTGRSMTATAPSGEPKHEVAAFCCALVAYLARDRGDRVALVAGDAERLEQLPPRASTQDLETLLRLLSRMWTTDDPAAAPANDLARLLDRALHAFTRRSLMVVVTDEARPAPEHEPLLRRLRVRHEVMALQVADLSPAGTAAPVADVDGTLFLPPFLASRPEIARAAADEVARRRAEVAATLRRRQVESTVVDGTDDVVHRFVELLGRQKRAGR